MECPRPRVGLGVFVLHPDGQRILVGKRKGSDGHGEWALPGGHLEFGESFEECAAREVLEETGLHVRDAQHVATENVVIRERAYHYVVIFMRAVLSDPAQQPRNCEPDKCEGWEWMRPGEVPEPIFTPLRAVVREHGYDPTARPPGPPA